MRSSSKGGMQSAQQHYTIICPKCGKPAARMELFVGCVAYMHYTKKSTVRANGIRGGDHYV